MAGTLPWSLLGVVAGVWMPQALGPWLLPLLPMVALLPLRGPPRVAALLALGLLWALLWQGHALSLRPDPSLGEPVPVSGRVVSLPEQSDGRLRFRLAPDAIAGTADRLPRSIRVTVYGELPAIAAGERWRLRLRLRRPRGFMNPVRFDYERWLAANHIDATAYLAGLEAAERLAPARGLPAWRSALSARIAAAAGAGDGSALLRGLVTGDRRGFDDALWEVLRATGTSHLMAISGLHVGLVAGAGHLIGGLLWGWLRLPGPRRLPESVLALLFATVYAGLAGFALPTIRALTMLGVLLGGRLLRLPLAPGRALGLAGAVVLLPDPAAALAPGFWLSFAAVAWILLVLRGRRDPAWRGLLRIQLMLTVGLAPVLALAFGELAPLALPVNLLVLPLFSLVVVPLALGGTLLLAWPPLAGLVLETLAGGLEALVAAGSWLAAVTGGTLALPMGPRWAAAAATLAALLLALPAGFPGRRLVPALALPLLLAGPPPLAPGTAEIAYLEVGQGSAAVIRTRGTTTVVDTGPAWSGGANAATFTLIPYLEGLGVQRIDTLMVTHADADHRGGLPALRARFDIGRVIAGEALPGDVAVSRCHRGQRWERDGVAFDVLGPPAGHAWAGNAASCILAVATDGGRVLFTGDVEGAAESWLAETLAAPVDVLEVPHHGSAGSGGPALLAVTRPRHAVVSAGFRNAYGLPSPETLRRLRCAGARVHDLGRTGAARFRLGPEGVRWLGDERRRRAGWLHEDLRRLRFRGGEQIHYAPADLLGPPQGTGELPCGN
ncbi:DNA internalization-related competence protein ComEC/Rec2 [Sediminicurvatus halobius]|uniref:DNA internalization-related competence protein ComEC/Rec2 n=1 Tax=Sediminicurvatus halobius TaxID=2182432 RepID=A0A2U2N213_9GAMM|nr:DNA internalization-related competence protein ComEC/Rec2 [Spiribacter halobius]PWG63226.1 DNA internalization-related competence protein ComEC/Rec2 [Spiribacter halobius]UEX76704.1 DNA internalization-related competence protein ComEC/Rec2 [Spiribacter halobius]